VPLPTIVNKAKLDWKFVRDHIDYVNLGNHYILCRFTNVEHKEMVG